MADRSKGIRFSGSTNREGRPGRIPEALDLDTLSYWHYLQIFGAWLHIVWLETADVPEDPVDLVRDGFDERSLDREFRAYAVTNGLAGLNKPSSAWSIWYSMHLSLRWPWTLVASRAQPHQDRRRIVRKEVLPPREVVGSLSRALELDGPFATMWYDGRTGHCITIRTQHKSGDLKFHDSWPGRSLLCRENNIAGVDARRDDSGHGWLITPAELEKVIFAYLISTEAWDMIKMAPAHRPRARAPAAGRTKPKR